MPAHTEGEWQIADFHTWHFDEATGMGFRFRPIVTRSGCVAWVADDEGDPECEPNARLVASGPDMLAALEAQEMAEADPESGRRKGYFDNARELREAALAKVRG